MVDTGPTPQRATLSGPAACVTVATLGAISRQVITSIGAAPTLVLVLTSPTVESRITDDAQSYLRYASHASPGPGRTHPVPHPTGVRFVPRRRHHVHHGSQCLPSP